MTGFRELKSAVRRILTPSRTGPGEALRTPRNDQVRPGHLGKSTPARSRLTPGARDLWSRFLLARLTWILLMTVVVTAGAGGFLAVQKPIYKSQATVAVYPASGAGSGLQPFVMGTEKGVASSGAVLSLASQSLLIPVSKLQSGLSISIPVDSDLLVISYSDRDPQIAQSVAEAVAQAYVAYRTTALGSTGTKPGSSSAVAIQAAVVTDATLPTSPDGPNPLLTIGIALILGLSLGIGLALVLDWLDDALRGPLDLQSQANAPILGQIPAMDRKSYGTDDRLVTVMHPNSAPADAYGNLRTRVLQAAALRGANTLLVTSPAAEDRATVAANLAAGLALSGRRVVLVCADLHWGRTHDLFRLENRIGLTSVVHGDAALADALAATEVHGLQLVSSGPASPDPSGVLQSPAFQKLLDTLRSDADLVVIDGPPVLAGADVAVLAELDAVILLVADARVSTRADVRAAAKELGYGHYRVIGCVLDNVGRPIRLRRAFTRPDSLREPSALPVGIASPDLGGGLKSSSTNGHISPQRRSTGTKHPVFLVEAAVAADNLAAMPAANASTEPRAKTKRHRYKGRNEQ